jgi:hypothetical protein
VQQIEIKASVNPSAHWMKKFLMVMEDGMGWEGCRVVGGKKGRDEKQVLMRLISNLNSQFNQMLVKFFLKKVTVENEQIKWHYVPLFSIFYMNGSHLLVPLNLLPYLIKLVRIIIY